jgi:hypothetical protein
MSRGNAVKARKRSARRELIDTCGVIICDGLRRKKRKARSKVYRHPSLLLLCCLG